MNEPIHLTPAALEAGLEVIRQSPKDDGVLELIVCRPGEDQRLVLEAGELTPLEGLAGDDWRARGSWETDGAPADADVQLTLMNARAIALIAQERARWPLAGDQFYVDLDLSAENLPPGTRLALGTAIVEITATPHTGCSKFSARFGVAAMRFVNSKVGKALRLRGVNARVVQAGSVKTGEMVRKL